MLNLAHRRHTGKYLPHHHTSYHGLFLVLLLVGIAMFSITRVANADSMTVSAKIPAPIPTVPATMSAPTEGQEFDDPHITVEGTCEVMTPDIIIEIWSNGTFLGSGPCQSSDASYSVNVTLLPGWNALVPRSVNITDDYGPDGATVNVKYNAPIPPPPPAPSPSPPPSSGGGTTGKKSSGSTSTGTPAACAPGGELRLGSEQTHLVFGKDSAAQWDIAVTGGCAPYLATIDWGDGKQTKFTIEDNDVHTYFHRYNTSRSYVATISVEDSGTGTARFSVAATTSTTPEIFGTTEDKGWPWNFPFLQTTEGLMVLLYLVYLLMLALFAAAWYDAYINHLRFAGFHVFPPPPPGSKKHGLHNRGRR